MANYNKLSEHTFIPFEVHRLKKPSVFWVNYDLVKQALPECENMNKEDVDAYLIETFSFMVPPGNADFDEYFTDQKKSFIAERYGSHGETCNGGGVRCGNHLNVQVKGCGKNLLANGYMDYWHTHGAASLEEGIREALWGEFFHQNAPFGSARILAVIKTGLDIDFDFNLASKDGKKTPGALILRQTIVRPAHFERAIYFNSELPFDFYRVQDNCEKLQDITGENDPKIFIKKQVSYFSYLSAWLKVKRISHGAITTGNIGVNGTMIDFGTATSFLDHGNYLISKGFPPFWGDHTYFSNILKTLNFYLNKYHSESFLDNTEIETLFFDNYNMYLSQFWLYQAGFHEDFCKIESEAHNKFSAGINLLATACEDIQRMPPTHSEPLARYNIVNILKILTDHKDKTQVSHLSCEIPEESYARHILGRFLEVLSEYNIWKDQNNVADTKGLHDSCGERNIDLIRLTRNELFRDITEKMEQGKDISGWMDVILKESKLESEKLPFELECV